MNIKGNLFLFITLDWILEQSRNHLTLHSVLKRYWSRSWYGLTKVTGGYFMKR
jgi:hypothetical protein